MGRVVQALVDWAGSHILQNVGSISFVAKHAPLMKQCWGAASSRSWRPRARRSDSRPVLVPLRVSLPSIVQSGDPNSETENTCFVCTFCGSATTAVTVKELTAAGAVQTTSLVVAVVVGVPSVPPEVLQEGR